MTSPLDVLSGALAGRYTIERKLGEGGMATVFLAEDLKHHRKVAIKVLKPELAHAIGPERFLREITVTAGLHHPHILPLLDSGTGGPGDSGTGLVLFYTMPFVDGESLRDRLNREARLPLADALRITAEIADALGYAHTQGIVHRDIKPENILFVAGHAMVSDFGIARAISSAGTERLTETGLGIGTPAYMSPEQAFGERDLDGRSDIYSLACVLFEMLSGEPPFTGPSAQAIVARHSATPAPPLHTRGVAVPLAVEAALDRALAKTPEERYSAAQDFARALEAGTPVSLRFRLRRRRRALALVVLLLAGLTGTWWWKVRAGGAHVERLAVLPLANFAGDSSQGYFVQGVHDALISELQQAGLTVLGRTSVLAYEHTQKTVREIARELGVDAVIEGSVYRAGDSVEILARLIDGRTEAARWQHTYRGDLRDVFTLYHEVTGAIAGAVRVALSPDAAVRLATARSVDPRAYDDYLQGQFHWQRLTPEETTIALEYFERALRRDSTYALAQVGIALVWVSRMQMGITPALEAIPRADSAATRALALDSTLVEVQYATALVRYDQWDWEGSDRAFRRAIAINPNFPEVRAFYSNILYILGRPGEARAQIDRAVAMDPLNPLLRSLHGIDLVLERRLDDAVAEFQEVLRLVPDAPIALQGIYYAYHDLGRYDLALAAHHRAHLAWGDHEVDEALTRGYEAGGYKGAMRHAADVLSTRPYTPNFGPFMVALLYLYAGETDSAFTWMERAYRERDPNLPYLVLPDLDPVRDDPRFRDLTRRMRLPPS